MPYGIVLLPDRETSLKLIGYASAFHRVDSPLMTVGVNAYPHVTLLQLECSTDDALRWWDHARRDLPAVLSIRFACLAFSPVPKGNYHVPEGGVYVGLEAVRDAAVEAAHATAVRCAELIDGTPLTEVGKDFRPHVTLGILRDFPDGRIDLPPDIVTGSFDFSPVLGVLGDYGTIPKFVETNPPA